MNKALQLAELLCSQPHSEAEMAEVIAEFLRAHDVEARKEKRQLGDMHCEAQAEIARQESEIDQLRRAVIARDSEIARTQAALERVSGEAALLAESANKYQAANLLLLRDLNAANARLERLEGLIMEGAQ